MTALGVITENVREIYAREVDACYVEAGKTARGPKFLDCLQRHVRSQKDALDAMYDARMSYLGSYSPELAASLQKAHTAWLQYRDANCSNLLSSSRLSFQRKVSAGKGRIGGPRGTPGEERSLGPAALGGMGCSATRTINARQRVAPGGARYCLHAAC